MTKRHVEINKGMRIGGPFDGREHSIMFFLMTTPKGINSRENGVK